MTERRILHLAGSSVSAFWSDLSLLYANACLEELDPDGWLVVVQPDGRWQFPGVEPLALADAIPLLTTADVVVPYMFDRPGMTAYRGLLDVLGVPYVGNRPETMALAADKARCKAVVAAAGVTVAEGETLTRGQTPTLLPPVVVKPVDADNSTGVSLVRDAAEFSAALETAFEHGETALVERYVELGREVRCGAVERDGELLCLPVEEYPIADSIRRYDDKLYAADGGGLATRGGVGAAILDADDPVTAPVHDAVRRAHAALGCRHYSLFDFRVDPAGQPVFLEAGLYCSFSRFSPVARTAAAAGIELEDLFRTAIEGAL